MFIGCEAPLDLPPRPIAFSASPATFTVAPLGSQLVEIRGGSPPFAATLRSGSGATGDAASSVSVAGQQITYKSGADGSVRDVIAVTDSAGREVEVTATVTSALQISPPVALVAPQDSVVFTVRDGQPPYQWAPPGVVEQDGRQYTFHAPAQSGRTWVQVTDANGSTLRADIAITDSLAIFPLELSVAPGGRGTFTALGGKAPYHWTLYGTDGDPVPTGVTLDAANGTLSVDRTLRGGFSFDVEVSDSALTPNEAVARVSVTTGLTPPEIPEHVAPGTALSLIASGGQPPYTYRYASVGNRSVGSLSLAGDYVAGPNPLQTDRVVVTDAIGTSVTISIDVGLMTISHTAYSGIFATDAWDGVPSAPERSITFEPNHLYLPGGHITLESNGLPKVRSLEAASVLQTDDFNGDGLTDALVRDSAGKLRVYSGVPGGDLQIAGGGVAASSAAITEPLATGTHAVLLADTLLNDETPCGLAWMTLPELLAGDAPSYCISQEKPEWLVPMSSYWWGKGVVAISGSGVTVFAPFGNAPALFSAFSLPPLTPGATARVIESPLTFASSYLTYLACVVTDHDDAGNILARQLASSPLENTPDWTRRPLPAALTQQAYLPWNWSPVRLFEGPTLGGNPSLILSTATTGNLLPSVYTLANGAWTLASALRFPAPVLGTGDFNADGNLDLLMLDDTLQLVFHEGNVLGDFDTSSAFPVRTGVDPALVTADLNGDGADDLLLRYGSSITGASETDGLELAGGAERGLALEASSGANSVRAFVGAADLDGDGAEDPFGATSENTLAFISFGCGQAHCAQAGPARQYVVPGVSTTSFSHFLAVDLKDPSPMKDLLAMTSDPSLGRGIAALIFRNPVGSAPLQRLVLDLSQSPSLLYASPLVMDFDGDGTVDVLLTEEDYSGSASITTVYIAHGRGAGKDFTFEGLRPLASFTGSGTLLSDSTMHRLIFVHSSTPLAFDVVAPTYQQTTTFPDLDVGRSAQLAQLDQNAGREIVLAVYDSASALALRTFSIGDDGTVTALSLSRVVPSQVSALGWIVLEHGASAPGELVVFTGLSAQNGRTLQIFRTNPDCSFSP